MTEQKLPNLITVDEAADMLGLARATVARWASQRLHLTFYKIGGIVRVDADSIPRFLAQAERPPLPRAVNQ